MLAWGASRGATSFALALLVVLWPATVMAAGPDDAAPGVPGMAVGSAARTQFIYHPSETSGGYDAADPDTFENASSGWYEVRVDATGTSEAVPNPHTGSCEPTSGSLSTTLRMPALTVGSNPSGPVNREGQGGVVGVRTWFWVAGPDRDTRSKESDLVDVTVTNCVVDHFAIPPHLHGVTEHYSAQVRYSVDTPTWDWGDGASDVGWGQINGEGLSHSYDVSSARCIAGPPNCMNIADKGPSYIVQFVEPVHVQLMSDSPAGHQVANDERPASRFRVYPVREVQSVLDR